MRVSIGSTRRNTELTVLLHSLRAELVAHDIAIADLDLSQMELRLDAEDRICSDVSEFRVSHQDAIGNADVSHDAQVKSELVQLAGTLSTHKALLRRSMETLRMLGNVVMAQAGEYANVDAPNRRVISYV